MLYYNILRQVLIMNTIPRYILYYNEIQVSCGYIVTWNIYTSISSISIWWVWLDGHMCSMILSADTKSRNVMQKIPFDELIVLLCGNIQVLGWWMSYSIIYTVYKKLETTSLFLLSYFPLIYCLCLSIYPCIIFLCLSRQY